MGIDQYSRVAGVDQYRGVAEPNQYGRAGEEVGSVGVEGARGSRQGGLEGEDVDIICMRPSSSAIDV